MRRIIRCLTVVLAAVIVLIGSGARQTKAAGGYWTDWSEWSTKNESGHTQTESRKVESSYDLINYLTQQANSPYYRCYRSFSIGKNYSAYNARSSYGEFYHTANVTAAKFKTLKSYAVNSYYSAAYGGYNKGNGTAYAYSEQLFFVSKINYTTQYRYRDYISIPDPEPTKEPENSGSDNSGSDNSGSDNSGSNQPGSSDSPGSTPSAPSIKEKIPVITDARAVKKGIRIKWKKMSGVTGYCIYCNGKQIAKVKGTKTAYLHRTSKKHGKIYKYYIRAYKKTGKSVIKSKKSNTAVVIFIKMKIKPHPVKVKEDRVRIRWTPDRGAYGYEIIYGKDKNRKHCKSIIVVGGDKASKVIKNLDPGTRYYFKIRIIYIYKGNRYYSDFCKWIIIKTPVPVYTHKGIIKNAEDGKPVKDAELIFRKGKQNKTGSVYKRCRSDSRGRYKCRLKKGYYTIEVRRSNFVTIYIVIYVYIDSPGYSDNTISISRPLKANQYRIVLTWGKNPTDLDSHLTGPSNASGGRYHVYFSNRDGYYSGRHAANLDVDDVTSYGPETITVNLKVRKKGVYKYYVHDFTNRMSAYSKALARSKARVTVYRGSHVIATYKVPKKAGTLWHVFTIKNGKLIRKNKMSYLDNQALIK